VHGKSDNSRFSQRKRLYSQQHSMARKWPRESNSHAEFARSIPIE
jgi:hypothetical protein